MQVFFNKSLVNSIYNLTPVYVSVNQSFMAFFNRQYSSEYYLNEAKKLKHQADKEVTFYAYNILMNIF